LYLGLGGSNIKHLPSLNDVLQYQNADIIARYKKDYPENKLSAEDALHEILKFFWAGQLHSKLRAEEPDNEALKFHWSLHPEMKEIDDMWHTFVLFTKEYRDFCNHYFGQFIDHSPKTDEDKKQAHDNYEEHLSTEIQRMLSFVYDHLGEETLRFWFAEHFEENDNNPA
jgi:hypothetical protein